MAFEELWKQLCEKKPELANQDSSIRITSGALKKLLRQTYEQGMKNMPQNKKTLDFLNLFGNFRR